MELLNIIFKLIVGAILIYCLCVFVYMGLIEDSDNYYRSNKNDKINK